MQGSLNGSPPNYPIKKNFKKRFDVSGAHGMLIAPMKNVVSTKEVAHLWAHQTQESARNGAGHRKNFYFEGATIYSYGRHFPIARIIEHNGKKAILFTTEGYSVTTSKHIHLVRRAIPKDIPVFYVSDVSRMPDSRDIKEKQDKAANMVAKSRRARTYKASYLSNAQETLMDAQLMQEFFGIDYVVFKMGDLGILADEIEKARKVDAENKRKQEAARLQAAQESIENWKNGVPYANVPYNIHWAYGRIEKGELVTSKGARVPIAHISRVSRIVRGYITQGKTFVTNGHKIPLGPYQLSEITADGPLRAGCHTFQKDEVIRILDLVDKFCLDVSTVGVFPTGV
jgi:hypothetical protein